jgi:hypothetical protein
MSPFVIHLDIIAFVQSLIDDAKKKVWVYVEENRLDLAEWFCKVDYDTFFFTENVRHYVRR